MSSAQVPASARPSAAGALLRDPVMQLAAWLVAAEVALVAVPVVDPSTVVAIGAARFQIPFLAAAVVAAFSSLNRTVSRDERRFWQTLGVGCLGWLVTATLATVFPRRANSPVRDATVAAGYLCFYVPLMVAVWLKPHLPQVAGRGLNARRFGWWGLGLFSVCWIGYSLVPQIIDPAWSIVLPSVRAGGPMFIGLDVIIVGGFIEEAIDSESPRWTVLYASIAMAMGAVLVTDVLDTQAARQLMHLSSGTGTDVIWGVPPLCLLVAFRLRHLEWSSTEPAATPAGASSDREPATVAFRLMALAAFFPLVHFALRVTGMLDAAVESVQNVVALAAMIVIGAMAMVAYRILERQRVAAARVRAGLEERLREAKKMEALARLSSVVTHEFLNLLNAIGGYIDLTLDDLGTDHPDTDNLRRAHDVVRRTTAFTTRLLVLSRGEPFHPPSVGFNEAVQNVMPRIRALLKPPAVVNAAIGHDDGRVAISVDSLNEVLEALATNASEAMDHGGRLSIETSWIDLGPQAAIARAVRPGRYAKLVVGDTGAGMPKEVLAHLFEPFFTTKPKPRARGLGLATVYVVINQHGGSVAVTSEVGVGTIVECLIPVAPGTKDRTGTGDSGFGIRDSGGQTC